MGNEGLRDRVRLLGGDNKIDIAHNFPAAPVTSGNIDMERIRMRRQIALQCLRLVGDLAELKRSGMLGALRDRLANLCLGGFAKSRQFCNAADFACFLQLLD